MRKLTDNEKSEIVYLLKMGSVSFKDIAADYKVNKSTISRIATAIGIKSQHNNPNTSLKASDIRDIFAKFNNGVSIVELASDYEISSKSVKHILARKTWRNIRVENDPDTVENILDNLYKDGFPYLNLSDKQILSSYNEIISSTSCFKSIIGTPSLGIRVINNFHREIFNISCGNGITPLNAFLDRDLLRRVVKAILKQKEPIRLSAIRNRLSSVSGVQKASNFPPATARAIYRHFNPTNILDFSAGWGGRMLGAMSLDIPYTGLDPSTNAITNNKLMLSKIESLTGKKYNVNLIQTCAEDYLGKGLCKPDLIFTSPPYFDTEKYSDEPTQSYIKFPTKDEWYEGFLKKCIEGAYSDLLPGGHLVLNIDYKLALQANYYAMATGFEMLPPAVMMLNSRTIEGHKSKKGQRSEPILIFKKAGVK